MSSFPSLEKQIIDIFIHLIIMPRQNVLTLVILSLLGSMAFTLRLPLVDTTFFESSTNFYSVSDLDCAG